MAKTAWTERNKRKKETVKKYAAKRAELKAKRDYAGTWGHKSDYSDALKKSAKPKGKRR